MPPQPQQEVEGLSGVKAVDVWKVEAELLN